MRIRGLGTGVPHWVGVCCALLIVLWPMAGRADEPKTAEEVIARHIEAIGGRKKLDSIRTMRMTGKVSFGKGKTDNAAAIEFKRSEKPGSLGKLRMEMNFEGMKSVQTFDGARGWVVMTSGNKPHYMRLPPNVIEMTKDQADLRGALVGFVENENKIELVGMAKVNGSDCYQLKVTKPGGEVEYHFVDSKTFLVVQIKGKRSDGQEFTVVFDDYKDVDGLNVAHTISGDWLVGDMAVEQVELNVDLPDSRFGRP